MKRAIIIGDSTYNTLGAIRSFAKSGIPLFLILVCKTDVNYVLKSKYINGENSIKINSLTECMNILESLSDSKYEQYIHCTADAIAEWVDENESVLCEHFVTPCRGKRIGGLFKKDEQCKLAEKCGMRIPKSFVYNKGEDLPMEISFPVLTKPLESIKGEKADIHICNDLRELIAVLEDEHTCKSLIIQEYIEKNFELNVLCCRTEKGIEYGGGVRKIRQYPEPNGGTAFAIVEDVEKYDVDKIAIEKFMEVSNFYGLFSIEFVAKDSKLYFLEVNFRNDMCAYSATKAGINLHKYYIDGQIIDRSKFKSINLMSYGIDYMFVKDKTLSLSSWIVDFLRTRCFLNMEKHDIMPTLWHYIGKYLR